MTAADLADLNGLVSLEAAERARAGDKRDPSLIATDVLVEAGMPDTRPCAERVARMIAWRNRPMRRNDDI